jgi:hypothetical protein
MGIGEVAGGHIEMGGKGPARAAARSIPPEQRSSDRRMTLREQPPLAQRAVWSRFEQQSSQVILESGDLELLLGVVLPCDEESSAASFVRGKKPKYNQNVVSSLSLAGATMDRYTSS